ncbi:MAG: GumC family protein [Geobacteraceae bacterium]
MSEIQLQSTGDQMKSSLPHDDKTINLLDYLQIIARRSGIIFGITLVAFVVSIIISLLFPSIYSSTARILPPQQDQGLKAAMLSQMGGLASLAGDMLGGGTSGDLYIGMLKTEVVKDVIIDRFNLMAEYKQKYRLDTYKVLDKTTTISLGKKEGIISITVEDKDPKRAADMANAFVEELEKLTVRLNISGAGRNRKFLEERLLKAKVDLARAEDSLKVYQLKNKALDVPEQAKATIEGIAQLKAELAVKEVQLAAFRAYITDENDEIKTTKASIENLKEQIARMEGSSRGSSIPTVGSVPALGQEYLRLMRELKIQETIFEMLTKQYEMAKLTEAKDVPGIQVLQKAMVPDKKIKPKRSVIVLLATFSAFFMSILLAFVLEYQEKMSEDDRMRWQNIRTLAKLRLPGRQRETKI